MANVEREHPDPIELAFEKLRFGLYITMILLLAIGATVLGLVFFDIQLGGEVSPKELLEKAQRFVDSGKGHMALPLFKRAAREKDARLSLLLNTYQRCRNHEDETQRVLLDRIRQKDEKLGNLIAKMSAFDEEGPKAFSKVVEIARKVLELRPEFAEARAILAANYIREGKLEEAQGHVARALQDYPDSPALLCERAMLALRKGNPSVALEDFELALESYPSFRPALAGYIRTCSNLGRYEDLVVFLKNRLDKDPTDYISAVNLALAQDNCNKEEQALNTLKSYLEERKEAENLATLQRHFRPRILHQLMKLERWSEVFVLGEKIMLSLRRTIEGKGRREASLVKLLKTRAKEANACLHFIELESDNCPKEHYPELTKLSLDLDKLRRKLKSLALTKSN